MKVRITAKIKGSEIVRHAAATPLDDEEFDLFDKIDSEFIKRYAKQMISIGLINDNINPIFEVKEFTVEGRKINLGNLKIKGHERK